MTAFGLQEYRGIEKTAAEATAKLLEEFGFYANDFEYYDFVRSDSKVTIQVWALGEKTVINITGHNDCYTFNVRNEKRQFRKAIKDCLLEEQKVIDAVGFIC
jgi:hypothetical protein